MKVKVKCCECGKERTADVRPGHKPPVRCGPCNYARSPFQRRFLGGKFKRTAPQAP